jgi:hypothetical protein
LGAKVNHKRILIVVGTGLVFLTALILIVYLSADPAPANAWGKPVPGAAVDRASRAANDRKVLQLEEEANNPTETIRLRTSGTSVVANGDFENGRDGSWVEHSDHGFDIIVDEAELAVPPYSGKWAAWLGGEHDDTSFIEQVVAIPNGTPTLTFWYWIGSEDICGYDTASVEVGGTVIHTFDLCSKNETVGWRKITLNLTDYAGQTVFLAFFAMTDGAMNSNFFVDDVNITKEPDVTPVPPKRTYGRERLCL